VEYFLAARSTIEAPQPGPPRRPPGGLPSNYYVTDATADFTPVGPCRPMPRLRSAVEVDVSHVVPIPGRHVVRGVVLAPSDPYDGGSRPLVWCCLPGGNCTSAYFDLSVNGDDSSYSMAAYLTDAGCTVLVLDHLGTGSSSTVDDAFLVTPEVLAAFTVLLEQLREGSLVSGLAPVASPLPIGLGHSMGAMITIIDQARHGTYGAVVNLGGGGAGLPAHLRDPDWVTWDLARLRTLLVDLARQQFSATTAARDGTRPGIFHADDVPPPVLQAFRSQLTTLLPSSALASILPSFSDPERGEIAVPLFLGFGEHDLAQVPHDAVSRFTSSPDITLFVLAGSGHCHNQAGNRRQLWDRMLGWARSTALRIP
jgi:alpha-beta hydrolase superfamily lysophospholipase